MRISSAEGYALLHVGTYSVKMRYFEGRVSIRSPRTFTCVQFYKSEIKNRNVSTGSFFFSDHELLGKLVYLGGLVVGK